MVLSGDVFSKTLDMWTGLSVVTPGDYSGQGDWPVVYLLHGLSGNAHSWAARSRLPYYAASHRAIFIIPEAARSFYTDMRHGPRYFTYIAQELPEICRSVFRISASPRQTFVAGLSMGGYGALKCALTYPRRYARCGAFSPSFLFLKQDLEKTRRLGAAAYPESFGETFIRDLECVYGADFEWREENDLLSLAQKAQKSPEKPVIYTCCGKKDFLYQDNLDFAREMRMLDLDFTFEDWDGDHDWVFFDAALEKWLNQCFGPARQDEGDNRR